MAGERHGHGMLCVNPPLGLSLQFTSLVSSLPLQLHIPVPVFCYIAQHRASSTVSINLQRKSNNMQQCTKILFHIYVKLNMFQATHRPSSGA
jgi:hypothetical protein